ncbi:MAG: DNA topoisomerase IV subunit B [Coxiella sp. (in: Bacteria)]|nr:MAG: DNA topoisomerase IV subunit B [Coxiella sp. (in: g-proteobacteria)]
MATKKTAKGKDAYSSEAIEVLSGLEPVQKRPGMYTDTTRPNHLGREAIDNSVDEAIAGHASSIEVTLYKDGSLQVVDNGRGMPVDIHSKHKISGVELILTRLHSGAKFSNKSYEFSGGLHGVGISVVNALSTKLVVHVKKGGEVYEMQFASGKPKGRLKKIGTCGPRQTGTDIRFWPDEKYFDSAKFAAKELCSTLRAKAVLCPGLSVSFTDEKTKKTQRWFYEDGLKSYLLDQVSGRELLPADPLMGSQKGTTEQVEWAVVWVPEGGDTVTESYVNLVPTIAGGTHVNGFRTGLIEAMREFCDLHKLLPRGMKLTADDLWDQCCYILSVKMQDPQFAGQIKERLSSRQAAVFVSGVVKDAFILWLNHHVEEGKALAELAIENAQKRMRLSKKVTRKKVTAGPALPGKLSDCSSTDAMNCEIFLVEGDSAGGSAKQARDRIFQAVMPLRGKILNTWEVASDQVLSSQAIHDIAIALGVDPDCDKIDGLRYGKVCILADADSDGAHIATLLCALFMRHFYELVKRGHIYVAMPPLYRIDVGKEVFYALDEEEKQGVLDRIEAEKLRGKVGIQRFKGLGEMNPMQLRETTMNPDTRRLVQMRVESGGAKSRKIMDMLLAKKRASDRKAWLEKKGDLADV